MRMGIHDSGKCGETGEKTKETKGKGMVRRRGKEQL
jgi:hypothetical protein